MSIDIVKEDQIISEFLKALGPWAEHVVIGGGYALIIYKLYLVARQLGDPPVGTHDLDSLISRKMAKVSVKDISEHLSEAGFKQFSKDLSDPASEAYVKEISGEEIEVEFLTDKATRKDRDKNAKIFGVVAQPLSYLEMSLLNKNQFKTYSGNVGNVVSPQAWIFHKGLTFLKRNDKIKAYKDLYGIWYAASQLQDLSKKAIDELKLLAMQSPAWFKTFQENLRQWIDDASPQDWTKLEVQDPFGKLKKQNFSLLVSKLTEEPNI